MRDGKEEREGNEDKIRDWIRLEVLMVSGGGVG